MTTAKIRSFQPNGYQETIEKGLSAIHSFSGNVKRVNVEGRFDALLNYFLDTFDEFLKATDDDGLRIEEISEVS